MRMDSTDSENQKSKPSHVYGMGMLYITALRLECIGKVSNIVSAKEVEEIRHLLIVMHHPAIEQ
jgi:hypothetical protein